jgi:cyclopropane fatty-acyl-phospholipid synthase-like methyltransferase
MSRNYQQTYWYLPGNIFDKYYFNLYKKSLTASITKKEVNFIEKILKLKKGMKILDLACGWGRHSIEFARRGYKVVGQDINPLFLQEARRTAKEAGVKVRWIKQDMRKIPFRNEFDVALSLFTSFGYFEKEEDHQKVMSEVYKSLKPRGAFFLDVINRERLVRRFRPKEHKELSDGSLLTIERKFDFLTGHLEDKRTYMKKKRKKKESRLGIRIFTLTELISTCQRVGLKFKKSYGSYKGDPISFNSKRCILIAQKP